MTQPSVDNMGLLYTSFEAFQASFDFRDHPFIDDAPSDQVPAAGAIEITNKRALVMAIAKDAGRIRE